MAQPIKQETKNAILSDSRKLTGNRTAKAKRLSAKYGISEFTIHNIIRPDDAYKRKILTPEEREQIKQLVEQEPGDVEQRKHIKIGKMFGVSSNTVRLIAKEKTKYFNPREAQF